MAHPRLEDVRPDWADYAGALLDIYIADTDIDDWRIPVEAVRQSGWQLTYSEDGEERSMPGDVEDVFAHCRNVALVWRIWPSEQISINCHFFVDPEMEFDANPREIQDHPAFDALCEFITTLGRAVGKPVLVGIEESRPRGTPALRYDPATDAVSAAF